MALDEKELNFWLEQVVSEYEDTQSLKKTAKNLDISTAKVRKALLTAGIWMNATAMGVKKARVEHPDWSDQDIADHLRLSINAVQMYTPYKLGPYDPENRTASADYTSQYRAKNSSTVDNFDMNRKEVAEMAAGMIKEASRTASKAESKTEPVKTVEDVEYPFDLPLNDTSRLKREEAKEMAAGLPFSRYRRVSAAPDAKPHVDDQFFLDYRRVYPAHNHGRIISKTAMKIRLEIDTSRFTPEELVTLQKEYDVSKGWTRDIILPSYIPLHYLHYVIQRAFGFENRCGHVFQLPNDTFASLGSNDFRTYCRLCGAFFRFPFGNDKELYWDDDYDGKKSIRTWLKEKYESSWLLLGGTGYNYVDNQYRIWQWLGDRVLDFHKLRPAFDEDTMDDTGLAGDERFYARLKELGAPDEYSVGELDGVALGDIKDIPQFPFNNILECIPLDEIMSINPEGFRPNDMEDTLSESENELLDELFTLEKARAKMKEAEYIYLLISKRVRAGWDEDTLLVKRWQEAAKEAARLFILCKGGPSIQAVTDEIVYLYDFGVPKGAELEGDSGTGEAKWRIKIKLLDVFYNYSFYYGRDYTPADAQGVDFMRDLEHEIEWADRLHAMCYCREKLEVLDFAGNEIRPHDEALMNIELRPEQELLPEEREEIEKSRRKEMEYNHSRRGYKERDVVINDNLYGALKTAILELRPVCVHKEGADPGEDFPAGKPRNHSLEKQV